MSSSEFDPALIKRKCTSLGLYLSLGVLSLFLHSQAKANETLAIELPAVSVTALFDALAEQRFSSGQKIVIEADEIRSLGGLSVAEVLRKLPGLDRSGSGTATAAGANARGISRDSVTILVNGERPTASGRHALTMVGRLPAEELARIELVRGASAEFGAGSEVVVNLVLKTPKREWSSNMRLVIGMRADEPNLQFSGGVSGAQDGFSWSLPVTANKHRMPVSRKRNQMGALDATDTLQGVYRVDEAMLTPRFSWSESGRKLSLWPSFYQNSLQRDQQLSISDAAGATLGERRDRERGGYQIARLRGDGETAFGDDGKLTLRMALMQGSRDSRTTRVLTPLAGPVLESSESIKRLEHEVTASARIDHPVGESHLLSIGLEAGGLNRRERERFGVVSSQQRQQERQGSMWIQDEWIATEQLSLTYGLRLDGIRQQNTSTSRRDAFLDPSIAVRWEASDAWVLRASAGRGVRFPKLDELTSLVTRNAEGALSPLLPDEVGQPELKAERINRVELSAEHFLLGERGVIGLTLYGRTTRNYVESRVSNEAGRWVKRPENVGTASHWGAEIDARLDTGLLGQWGQGGMLRAAITLPDSRVKDHSLGLHRIANDSPRHLMTLSFDYSPRDALTGFGVQAKHTGQTRTSMSSVQRERKAATTRVDAHLTRRLPGGLNLRLSAENIFGQSEHVDRWAQHAGQHWRMRTREGGERTWLLSLDGKW